MKLSTLGSHVEVLSGFAFRSELFNNEGRGLPLIRIRDVKSGTTSTFYDGSYEERFIIHDGDLLIGMDGEFNCERWRGGRALLNQRVCRVKAVSANLDEQYLFHFLPDALKAIEQRSNFVTVKHLSGAQIRHIVIPLPPLTEQRRIAAILDQANELRRKRLLAIEHIAALAPAVFDEMFGNLAANSMRWPKFQCADLCKRIVVGVVVKPASYYCDTGVPAVRGTNIKPTGIDLSDIVYFSESDNVGKLSKSRIWVGDLLVVRTGQPGLCAIVPKDLNGANAIDVIIVTPKTERIRPIFLRELINSAGGRQMVLSQSRGQIQQHFNVGSLSAASIIVPPLSLQEKFEEQVYALETVRASAMSSLERIDALFASLQHRAFAGELTAKQAERELEMAG